MPACLEVFVHEEIEGESIIVVHCRSNKDRRVQAINASLPQLARVRKCCPSDAVFDSRTKACVSRLSESDSLVGFLGNGSADLVLAVTEGPPTCEGPIVDYEIGESDVFLRNGAYSVSKAKNLRVHRSDLLVTFRMA